MCLSSPMHHQARCFSSQLMCAKPPLAPHAWYVASTLRLLLAHGLCLYIGPCVCQSCWLIQLEGTKLICVSQPRPFHCAHGLHHTPWYHVNVYMLSKGYHHPLLMSKATTSCSWCGVAHAIFTTFELASLSIKNILNHFQNTMLG